MSYNMTWCDMERYVPGHALHEKCLQRQIGVGTLVSSQERRAVVVPRIYRLQTADKPIMNFVPPSIYIGFRLLVLPARHSGQLSPMP